MATKILQVLGNIPTLDDTKVGATAWSSKNIVDKLCPAFMESGDVVTCQPVAGYPLEVVSGIAYVQESGDAAAENLLGDYKNAASWGVAYDTPSGDPEFCLTIYTTLQNMPNINMCLSYDIDVDGFCIEYDSFQEQGYKELKGKGYVTLTGEYMVEAGGEPAWPYEFCRIRYSGVAADDNWLPDDGFPEEFANALAGITLTLTEGAEPPFTDAPIIGHSAVTLRQRGKNWMDDVAFFKEKGFVKQDDGSWYGTPKVSKLFVNKNQLPGQFTISWNAKVVEDKSFLLVVCYTDGTAAYPSTNYKDFTERTFTTDKNKVLDYIQWTYANSSSSYYIKYFQVEYGTTATAYEPYQGKLFTIDLGQTVYGGSYNWTTGKLTVTHGYIDSYASEDVPDGWISSTGALTEGAQIIYPLAEPVTVQLALQEILALSGTNTLYSDTGDTTVTGRADPTAVIEKLTNAIIALGGNV